MPQTLQCTSRIITMLQRDVRNAPVLVSDFTIVNLTYVIANTMLCIKTLHIKCMINVEIIFRLFSVIV